MADKILDIKVESNLPKYEQAFEQVVRKILVEWGMTAESAAKRLCPVDTGLLRNSITYAVAGQTVANPSYQSNSGDASGSYAGQAPADKGEARHVHIGSNVEYALEQEVGSFKHKTGQSPYLRPAIEQNKEQFQKILEDELKNALIN